MVDVLLKRHQAERNSRMGVDHNNILTQFITKQSIYNPNWFLDVANSARGQDKSNPVL